jgi:hypothetical protein
LVSQHLERSSRNSRNPLVSLVANDRDQRFDLSRPPGRDDTEFAQMTAQGVNRLGSLLDAAFRGT